MRMLFILRIQTQDILICPETERRVASSFRGAVPYPLFAGARSHSAGRTPLTRSVTSGRGTSFKVSGAGLRGLEKTGIFRLPSLPQGSMPAKRAAESKMKRRRNCLVTFLPLAIDRSACGACVPIRYLFA